jgi:hypothetical protein
VTDFLLDAKERGFVVPDWLLQHAIKNLQERLQENERYVDSRFEFSDVPEHLDLAARAYAGYVLSRTKEQAPLGTLRAIYDQDAGKAASGLPLVHLGLALNTQGDKRRGNESIQKGLALVRDDQKYLGDYGSKLRDQAAILYLLLKDKVNMPEQAALISGLADSLHNKDYLSTQEQLFTLLAGLKVQEKAKEGWKASLKTGTGVPLDLTGTGMQNRLLSVDDLQKGVQVTSTGKGKMYIALNVDGYPDVSPALDTDPIDVQREWYNMQGKKVPLQDIKVGDLLLTHLLISSSSAIHDALVADLVPAAFEIENTNLSKIESLGTLQLDGMDKPVSELLSGTNTRYQEFRDDRYIAALSLEAKAKNHLFYLVRVVSPGTFTIPPSYAEDMYRPELNGVGVAQGTLSIKP